MIKEIQNPYGTKAFIKLGFKKSDNNIIAGNVWYQIDGFKKVESRNRDLNLNFTNQNLKTTYLSQNEIFRSRILEPYWKDLAWSLNKENNTASWTLDKKYLEYTLLQTNTSARSLNLTFHIAPLIFDSEKDNRQKQEKYAIKYSLNFDNLLNNQNYIYQNKFVFDIDQEHYEIPYKIQSIWNPDKGIEFTFKISDENYKMLIDVTSALNKKDNLVFDKNRAIIIAPYASKVVINYINSIEDEGSFRFEQTNQYDYNNIDYGALTFISANQAKEPAQAFLLFNKGSQVADHNKYNPNQNVAFKHNEGYVPNKEWIRKEWGYDEKYDLVKNVKKRALRYIRPGSSGSSTMIGKVSDEPNDMRFYILTNQHVENAISRNSQLVDSSNKFYPKTIKDWRSFMLPYNRYGNDLRPGTSLHNFHPSYTNQNADHNLIDRNIEVIWTGIQSSEMKNNNGSNGRGIDATVSIVDFASEYKRAINKAQGDTARFLREWYELDDIKIDNSYKDKEIWVPTIRDIGHIGFPGWGGLTGYVNHRPNVSSTQTVFDQFPNYSPIMFGGGNSGTGFITGEDAYISLWNSGNGGGYSVGWHYDTKDMNYFGVNWNNENPLDLPNKSSLGLNILKSSLRNPEDFKEPWFALPVKG
nr:hypothetical protein [Mycoplasma leonicaptivi]